VEPVGEDDVVGNWWLETVIAAENIKQKKNEKKRK
jgi:hypothetical protein